LIELGGDTDVHLREATGEDGLDAKVDFVAIDENDNIVGYYKWVEMAEEDK